ncbi:MAG: hypothetical protein PHQ86_09770 [Dehalococcoidales bacterium]|nr:hypothetical protein [Dehalococcoidales bacterium]
MSKETPEVSSNGALHDSIKEKLKDLRIDVRDTDIIISFRDHTAFDIDSFRTKPLRGNDGVSAIIGCEKDGWNAGFCKTGMKVQGYKFSKDHWNQERANSWVESHVKNMSEMNIDHINLGALYDQLIPCDCRGEKAVKDNSVGLPISGVALKVPKLKWITPSSVPTMLSKNKSDYADPTNLSFLINSKRNVDLSMQLFSDQQYSSTYDTEEKAFIWNRIVTAAVKEGMKYKYDSSNILDQLLPEATVKGLIEERTKDHSGEHIVDFNARLNFDGFKFKGIAFAEGYWNGVYYDRDVVKSIFDAIDIAPVVVEHGRTNTFLNRGVAKINKKHWIEELAAIAVEGEITDEDAKYYSKQGLFKGLSPRLKEFEEVDDGVIHARKAEIVHLSLVETPACSICYISPVLN